MIQNKRLLLAFSFACLGLAAQQVDEPRYTTDNRLILPGNYREWIFLTSGLGMSYGLVDAAASKLLGQSFDNVFVSPQAYKSFLQTGTWPDKTIFVKEVRTSATKGSMNKGGHYQEGIMTIEAHVKDQARFPDRGEFFVFGSAETAKPLGPKSGCIACHSQHGAVDGTFVQFYPTLISVAKAKGTMKQQGGK
ncbi:MAG: cytochrome P460 family protein [Bryobacteraceae bacterium]